MASRKAPKNHSRAFSCEIYHLPLSIYLCYTLLHDSILFLVVSHSTVISFIGTKGNLSGWRWSSLSRRFMRLMYIKERCSIEALRMEWKSVEIYHIRRQKRKKYKRQTICLMYDISIWLCQVTIKVSLHLCTGEYNLKMGKFRPIHIIYHSVIWSTIYFSFAFLWNFKCGLNHFHPLGIDNFSLLAGG